MSHPDFDDLHADFGEVMDILNEGPLEQPVETPSEDLWQAIAAGLTDDAKPQSDHSEAPGLPIDQLSDARRRLRAGNEPADERVAAGVESGDAGPFQSPRASFSHRDSSIGKRFAIMTAVAAAVLLVAVPLALAIRGDSIKQRAELVALGASGGGGTAELTDDGSLHVRLDGLEPLEGAVYELWLLDLEGNDLKDLRSLGNVEEDGTFTIPDDLDLDDFSVVDVSIEPEDGDESHSGNSVLRGTLQQP